MLHILAPTDFSNNAYNALYYAARLFKVEDCKFHVVHVCGDLDEADLETAKLESSQGLDALIHRLVRDVGPNPKHAFEKATLCSDMTEGIAKYAAGHKIDLTVTGNKAKEEAKQILLGNNAMQLIREITTCPILVVPLEIDFKKVGKLAFVSNYVNPISKKNIATLQFFAKMMDCALVPMSIDEGKETKTMPKHKTDFLAAISKNSSKEVVLPVFKDKVRTILEFVDLWNVDMLSMVYYPHHFFLEFIGKGIIKELNTKLTVPFLILPNGAS